MSASRSERDRFWIALFLEDMPPGTKFQPGALHITVIPWFVSDLEDAQVSRVFEETFADFKPLEVELGEQTFFGPKKNVGVTLVQPVYSLISLHHAALNLFRQVQGRWAVKKPHVDEQYIPHIRRRRGKKVLSGQNLHLNYLTLVGARRQEDGQRQVIARAGGQ